MSRYTKLIDLRNIDGKLTDLCGNKWDWEQSSYKGKYIWGGGIH